MEAFFQSHGRLRKGAVVAASCGQGIFAAPEVARGKALDLLHRNGADVAAFPRL